jgi:spore germination protein GerM
MRRRFTAAAIAGVAASVLVAGCGQRETEPAAGNDAKPTIETTVYFLTADRTALQGVRRSIPRRSPYALQALNALVAGPTDEERKQGLATAIPAEAKLVSFRIRAHTDAVVNLSGLPITGANGVERVRIIAQLTRSLVGLSGIARVWIRNDGEPWGLWSMRGGVENRPYDYDDMVAFYNVCSSKPGTETVPGECFSALP